MSSSTMGFESSGKVNSSLEHWSKLGASCKMKVCAAVVKDLTPTQQKCLGATDQVRAIR